MSTQNTALSGMIILDAIPESIGLPLASIENLLLKVGTSNEAINELVDTLKENHIIIEHDGWITRGPQFTAWRNFLGSML